MTKTAICYFHPTLTLAQACAWATQHGLVLAYDHNRGRVFACRAN